MLREELPITTLPAWCALHDVKFMGIKAQPFDTKGYGLAAESTISSKSDPSQPPITLLTIPSELVLNKATIEEHAKVDHHFRQLLGAAGGKITIASADNGFGVGVSNPWSEYVKLLSDQMSVPTMWTEQERELLRGTSLESSVEAKTSALVREYESLRESTSAISWCRKCWWDTEDLRLEDWTLVDAWFRSRSLEIPDVGVSMVPCLDMVNHSPSPNAYYEPTSDGGVRLLLRAGVELSAGSEVTISYGDAKSSAEMLFSYGFIEQRNDKNGLALPLEPLPGDIRGKAKSLAYTDLGGLRVAHLVTMKEGFAWHSPYLWLLCLNEEDGLDIKLLQQTDGSRSLKVFWQGSDITESLEEIETLLSDHPLKAVFRLRAISLLQAQVSQQLERLDASEEEVETLVDSIYNDPERTKAAVQLRTDECAILSAALVVTEQQELLKDEEVLRYLGSMENNEEEDFS